MENAPEKILLIVDDETTLRKSLAQYFKLVGYKVLEASGGIEALTIINKTDVHFVISDIRMPEGDGEYLLKELRKKNPKVPPVVLVSGFSEITRQEAQKLGALDLLEKPIDFELLSSYISTYV